MSPRHGFIDPSLSGQISDRRAQLFADWQPRSSDRRRLWSRKSTKSKAELSRSRSAPIPRGPLFDTVAMDTVGMDTVCIDTVCTDTVCTDTVWSEQN